MAAHCPKEIQFIKPPPSSCPTRPSKSCFNIQAWNGIDQKDIEDQVLAMIKEREGFQDGQE
jgi:hypothetical protein